MHHTNMPGAGADHWNALGRSVVFLLAATSIICLLFDFYGWCRMRTFTLDIFLPALVVLAVLSFLDCLRSGGRLGRAVMIGLAGGPLAAVAYTSSGCRSCSPGPGASTRLCRP